MKLKSLILTGLSCLLVVTSVFANEVAQPAGAEKAYSVKDFGAKGDGITNDLKAIQSTIDAAKKDGVKKVVFENKPYKINNTINVDGMDGVVIDGQGATLINGSVQKTFGIANCKNTTIQNIKVDYYPLPYIQGVVTEMDPQGTWYNVKMDKGYKVNFDFLSNVQSSEVVMVFVAPNGEGIIPGTTDFNSGAAVKKISDDLIKVSFTKSVNSGLIKAGDNAIIKRTASPAFTVTESANCLISNVTVFASPGFAFMEKLGDGGNRFESCRVTPGRRPAGAVRERLYSSNADSFHSAETTKGPVIENCLFEKMGDDGVNVHGFYSKVVEQKSPTEIISKRGANIATLKKGDTIEICEGKTMKIISKTTIDDAKDQGADAYYLKLKTGVTVNKDDLIVCPDRVGNGAIVRNTTIRYNRGRGILMRGSDSIIENNTIEKISLTAGIALFTEVGFWTESHVAKNVTIKGNKIKDIGLAPVGSGSQNMGAITVRCQMGNTLVDNREFKNIIIKDNVIENSALMGVFLVNTSGAEITGNTFTNTNCKEPNGAGSVFGITADSAIHVLQSEKVNVLNNTFKPGKFTVKEVNVDKTADQASVKVTK